MNDAYILERGYKQYTPVYPIDDDEIVAKFQKRFDDDFGKKYFINISKWSNEYIPESHRDKWWTPFTYEYNVQVTMGENENPINMLFFSSWTLEQVENFMEDFFEKMKPNYYEDWNEHRRVIPSDNKGSESIDKN